MPVILSLWEAVVGKPPEVGSLRPAWPTWRNLIFTKNTKISWVLAGQWLMPVIPAVWLAKAGKSPEVRSSRAVWPTWRNPVSTKNTKISWAWWHMPVVPASPEAEAGKSLEPRRRRLQWAEIAPLHCSLANRARLQLKKKRGKPKNQTNKNPQSYLDSLLVLSFLPT